MSDRLHQTGFIYASWTGGWINRRSQLFVRPLLFHKEFRSLPEELLTVAYMVWNRHWLKLVAAWSHISAPVVQSHHGGRRGSVFIETSKEVSATQPCCRGRSNGIDSLPINLMVIRVFAATSDIAPRYRLLTSQRMLVMLIRQYRVLNLW